MKRLLILLLAVILVFSLPFSTAFATEIDEASAVGIDFRDYSTETIWYSDGSSLEVHTESNTVPGTRNSLTGERTYLKKDSSGALEWKATLTATFTYNGSTSTCTSASCSVPIYKSNWYVVSCTTARSGNTATTNLTMGYKVNGSTLYTRSYTITLSCDANGNLS